MLVPGRQSSRSARSADRLVVRDGETSSQPGPARPQSVHAARANDSVAVTFNSERTLPPGPPDNEVQVPVGVHRRTAIERHAEAD
jgi:hypothetical protein